MTRNQIEYWRNVETQRANQANEAEVKRANQARELETYRSNLARERENTRSNMAQERLGQQSQLLSLKQNQELNRLEKNKQAETHRSNTAREREAVLQRYQDAANKRRADSIAYYQANTARQQALETARSHRANENITLSTLTETNRSNIARETENVRTHMANEAISARNVSLQSAKLQEEKRANRASELITQRGQNFQLVGNLANASARILSGMQHKTGQLKGVLR